MQVPQQISGDQRVSFCEEMLSNQKVQEKENVFKRPQSRVVFPQDI